MLNNPPFIINKDETKSKAHDKSVVDDVDRTSRGRGWAGKDGGDIARFMIRKQGMEEDSDDNFYYAINKK